jgi:hypothetical protein
VREEEGFNASLLVHSIQLEMVEGSAALGNVWLGFISTTSENLQIEACPGTVLGGVGSVV